MLVGSFSYAKMLMYSRPLVYLVYKAFFYSDKYTFCWILVFEKEPVSFYVFYCTSFR